MLMLSLRRDEAITVDGPATVTVRKLSCGRVLLAIEARPEVEIRRDPRKAPSIDQEDQKSLH